jgi:hypothetical protein
MLYRFKLEGIVEAENAEVADVLLDQYLDHYPDGVIRCTLTDLKEHEVTISGDLLESVISVIDKIGDTVVVKGDLGHQANELWDKLTDVLYKVR